jgi:integrase
MANSNTSPKPRKPYQNYPLYAHASRRWAKKIRGRTHFFGPWRDDPQFYEQDWKAALERYEHGVHDLQRGRKPRPMGQDEQAITVEYLVNSFLAHREALVESGELQRQTWLDYKSIGEELVRKLGRYTNVEQLTPADFADLRKHFAKGKSLVTLKNSITRSMAIINYAHKQRLVRHPIDVGESFKKPKKVALKREKLASGGKSFTIEELRLLYHAANPQMKCFILLGLNGGMGNGDVGQLERRHIVDGWIDFPRPKTLVDRRFPLWKETVRAIGQTAQTKRADLPNVFLTKYGLVWFKDNGDDPISKEFRKLCLDCGVHKHGRGFYSLRHQFRSIARGCRDREAVDFVMGHADGTVAESYMEWGIDDARLKAVTDHVYAWVKPMFRKPAKAKGGAK